MDRILPTYAQERCASAWHTLSDQFLGLARALPSCTSSRSYRNRICLTSPSSGPQQAQPQACWAAQAGLQIAAAEREWTRQRSGYGAAQDRLIKTLDEVERLKNTLGCANDELAITRAALARARYESLLVPFASLSWNALCKDVGGAQVSSSRTTTCNQSILGTQAGLG